LSKNLNDQELLTLVRRFQDGDKYHYVEMADLFSHVHFLNSSRNIGTNHSLLHEIETFLVAARSRSTQWRRVFRKDFHTWQGKLTLNHLLKILKKHGLALSLSLNPQLISKFGLKGEQASYAFAQIKRVTQLHDQESSGSQRADVRSKTRLSESYGLEEEKESITQKKMNSRKRLDRASSIMRTFNSMTGEHSGIETDDDSRAVIDYHALCDCIYVCDWVYSRLSKY